MRARALLCNFKAFIAVKYLSKSFSNKSRVDEQGSVLTRVTARSKATGMTSQSEVKINRVPAFGVFKEHKNTVLETPKESLIKTTLLFGKKALASLCAFVIGYSPIAYSIAPTQVYAQQIIIDPNAPSSSLFNTGTGATGINIANPTSGVSVNSFQDFNVGEVTVCLAVQLQRTPISLQVQQQLL